tara:strand:+ start:100 stop:8400 length:8301 start_codon:yes stop_codon:yes gene_type:complete
MKKIIINSSHRIVFCLSLFLISITPNKALAQLTINNGLTATQLASLLAGPNITVTNASLTGSSVASGSFNGVNSNLGMSSGVILSTGDIANAPGPNNDNSSSNDLSTGGTSQMDNLAGGIATFDAITLQFDFSIQSDFVQFEYIFASEEYPEFAPPSSSSFNDVFAFFISGPGIIGEENIALIPGTTDPVTINNINPVTNNNLYIDNTGGTTVQYDAWTTPLIARRENLTPCQTYTMKLVIADAGDSDYNSSVFLLENSFIQGVVNTQTQTVNGDNIALEGCVPASFQFGLDVPSTTNTTITYQIGGTATNGVDYALIDTSLTIPAGQLNASIIINSIQDGIPEGAESIYIIYKPDICSPVDTAFLYINDAQPIVFTLDETDLTCFDNSTGEILVNASGGFPPYNYDVTYPQGGLTNHTTNPITGLPAGTYSVVVYDIYGCKAQALIVGGVFDADTLFLPDGNGVTYSTQIPISGFGAGETIDSLAQIQQICATMEHSYMGDLELKIIAPSGQSVILKEYPGGGSCDLGQPFASDVVDANSNLTNPGVGYEYCWNSTPTFVTMVGESNSFTHTIPSSTGGTYTDNFLPAGSYEPFEPLGNLLGALMDGNWTMEITDNMNQDNGYIFEWNISLLGAEPDTTVTINEPDSIQMSGFITQAQCGGTDGAINFTANGVNQPLTYLWSNGATTEDISGLSAGNYTVVVTDNTGCADSTTFNLNNISSMNITSIVTDVTCTGGNNGAISITTSGGTSPYVYSWDNGASTEDINTLTAGNYVLSITDGSGCQFSENITVGTLAPILITLNNSDNEFCGQMNGSLNIDVSGGSGSYGYSWDNGSSTQDISNIIAGTYELTVTDANGCQSIQSFNIINDVSNCSAYCFLTIASTVTDENCGNGTGTIDVTVSQATQPYIVSWNTGETIEDLTSLNAGTYIITVTDANQCVETVNIIVGNNTGTLDISSNQTANENCGNSDGSIDITVTGGTLPYTFAWDNGAVTEDVSNLTAGIYVITVTDGNGCTFSTSYTIINNTGSLAAAVQINNETCGNTSGSINLTVTGNAGALSYLWSNGATTQDINNLAAGLYSCTITDANSCELITSQYNLINESSTLLLSNTVITNENCSNGLGEINLTIQGGSAPVTYAWSNTETTEDITGLSAGTFSCTITDISGCEVQTGTLNLFNTPGNLDITTDLVTDEICNNVSGAINVTTTGGLAPITYSWSNGSTSEDISNLTANSYNLTATDANGCVFNHSEIVNNTSGTLQLDNAVLTDENCNNGTGSIDLFISGGSLPYTFAWNNGETTEDISSLSAGNYDVTITDFNGCQVSGMYTISNITGTLAVTALGTAENCSNGAGSIDITVTGGTPNYTYLWSNGATTDDLTGIFGGTYSCTITDDNSCTVLTGNIVINNNPGNLTVANITSDESCGNGTGTINLNVAGGSPNYTYSWLPNVSSGTTASGLSAATYLYTITDVNGCSITDSSEVFNNTGTLALDNFSVTDEICGNGIGAIDLTVSGGAAPVTYLWSNGSTTEDISGLSSGTFSCIISDNNGCSVSTSNINVSDNAGTLSIDNIVIIDESCGNTSGGINITITGGSTPYTFLWNTGATAEDILTGLSAGNYFCDVTDANGCSVQVQATVQNTQGSLSTLSNIVTDETCSAINGAIDLNPQGGSTPYSFVWSNGETTEDLTGITAGNYTVTITDIGGCSLIENFTVLNNGANILINNVTINNEICGNSAGGIDISIQSGASPFTFNWSNGSTSEDLTNVVAGNYSVTVTDANGCSTSGSFSIDENTGSLEINSFTVVDEVCGDGNGSIDLEISNGALPCCSYTLDMQDSFGDGWDGASIDVTINGAAYGNFTFTTGNTSVQSIPVCSGELLELTYNTGAFENEHSYSLTDANGNAVFSASAPPTAGLAYSNNAVCPSSNPAVTYNWNNGETTEDLTNLNSGFYSVLITDANGCSIDTSGTVQNITGGFTANLTGTTDENCADATGTINITVSGGSLPYTFAWDNGATSEDLSNLSAGNYILVVTDATGCSANITATVNNISGTLAITNAVTNDEVCNNGVGYIDLTVTGSATPFLYLWDNGATTQDLAGLSAGTYIVTITDATGCNLVQSYTVNNISGTLAITNAITNDENCFDGSGLIDLTISGGATPYSYLWNNGETTEDISSLSSGNYDITITDANGCQLMQAYNINDVNGTLALTNVTSNDEFCNDATGSIDISVTSTLTPLTFLWDNGATTEDISGLSAGTYTVTITNPNGCSIDTSVTIVNTTGAFAVSLIATTDENCGDATATIDIAVSGGSTPYTFAWDNGAVTEDLTNLSAGNYTVVVTDASGCSTNLNVTVNNNSGTLLVSNVITNDENCSDGTGSIDITVTSTSNTYLWNNGATTEDLSGLSAGNYTVTITDLSGCQLVASYTVNNNNGGLDITYTSNDEVCNNAQGDIIATVSGGIAPYIITWTGATPISCCTYTLDMFDSSTSWNGASVDVTINGVNVGNFTVLGGGANTGTFSVCDGDAIELFWNSGAFDNEASFNLLDAGGNVIFAQGTSPTVGSIFTGTGNCPAISSNPSTLNNLSGGTYYISVTDFSGCTITDSVIINNTLLITTSGTASDASCLTCPDGTIDITASGDAPFIFNWSNGASSEDLNSLTPGDYYVNIVSASGCTDSLFFTIGFPVGIDAANANWFVNLYPNPANEEFTLAYNFRTNSEVRYTIFNVIGELVHDEKIKSTTGEITISAEKMEAGVYFIQLTNDEHKENIKLIIAK